MASRRLTVQEADLEAKVRELEQKGYKRVEGQQPLLPGQFRITTAAHSSDGFTTEFTDWLEVEDLPGTAV